MRYLIAICMLTCSAGCVRSSASDVDSSSAGSVDARITVDNKVITFKKDFNVDIVVENNTAKPIKIDTSPDEVIKPAIEYRQKGSRCTISVTQDQDEDGKFDFFCTYDLKVLSPGKSMLSITIPSGKSCKLTFPISPWGPTYGSSPSTAIPGPAEISAQLRLLVDGQWQTIVTKPLRVDFVRR